MPATQITGLPRTLLVGVVGLLLGGFFSGIFNSRGALSPRTKIVMHPAAYQIPKIPGGTALRMAMLHDVLLERYLHHGDAWYTRRNDLSRDIIAQEQSRPTTTSPALNARLLNAMDDLAVGLENLHKSDQAAAVMRDKLAMLPPPTLPPEKPQTGKTARFEQTEEELQAIQHAGELSPEMHHQYTTRANLGTSLIHGSFSKALAGDMQSRLRLSEGVTFIEQSIRINPAAHFGRETWQAIVVHHFLAAGGNPQLARSFDIVGNDLRSMQPDRPRTRIPLAAVAGPESQLSIAQRITLRDYVDPLRPAPEWLNTIRANLPDRVPFDEPTLALMGMWMYGGGPNPHSALALADIALQVGQWEIAFDGYERALSMKDRLSPDSTTSDLLAEHCRKMQQLIAEKESPADPTSWLSTARHRHADELAWAMKYQSDYQSYEAAQIAAGVDLNDPSFYHDFFQNRLSIASPTGTSDDIAVRLYAPDGLVSALPTAILGAGICMMLAALTAERTRKPASSTTLPKVPA